jgi:ribosomal protein S18 acetylase RimI-like enzyme
MRVLKLTDAGRIRAFLETDRHWADYALGDLEPEFYPFTAWHGVEDNDTLIALAMLFRGFEPPIFFAMGEGRGIEVMLDQVIRESRLGLSVREEHLPIVARYYCTDARIPMWKMGLDASDLRPAASAGAQRLTLSDVPDLLALYAFGGGDAFRPREVASGVFYGIRQNGRLVAVAGTHSISNSGRIAALGNVMTHPQHRGQGLATIATGAVIAELVDRGIGTIGLSVARANAAAIRVYEQLGFKKHVPFFEGVVTRRGESPRIATHP